MENELLLSLAYSDLKDRHLALKHKYDAKAQEFTVLNKKYLELCRRYTEANDLLNRLLKEKWYIKGLTEEEKDFMLRMQDSVFDRLRHRSLI